MQIILLSIIFISILSFAIFKINNKFSKKEFIILIAILSLTIISFEVFSYEKENKIPTLFTKKYESTNNIKILKLSYEELSNKNISSSENFLYKFDYIINKENKEFLCTLNAIKIKKIQDECVFTNFKSLKEVCKEK